jgi:hypothetical protein
MHTENYTYRKKYYNIIKSLQNRKGKNKNNRYKIFPTIPDSTKCMFPESACLKTNFGTYLEFLSPAVAEKSLGEMGQFGFFFSHSQLYMVLLNCQLLVGSIDFLK